jgi:hypothetical protein
LIESSAIDSWVGGLDERRAGRAVLALGIETQPLVEARRYGHIEVAPIMSWSLDKPSFEAVVDEPPSRLAGRLPRRTYRVAVSGDVAGADVAHRVRGAPQVLSAFVAVDRPSGSLRRRPWRWPLRIGLVGVDSDEAEPFAKTVVKEGRLPKQLVDVRRVEDEPAAVDLLVTPLGLNEATSALVELKTIANAVVVAGEAADRWAVVEGQLTTIRAATGAVATIIVPAESLARGVGLVVREMSQGYPLDVAVDMAWNGDAVVWAEVDGLNRSVLPEVSLHLVREAQAAHRALAAAAPPQVPEAATALTALAAERFLGEAHEASALAIVGEELEGALAQVHEERWLQASVNHGRSGRENRFVAGANGVDVFIGPLQEGAALATEFDEAALPWEEEDAEAFRLTVVLASLEPLGEPQSAEIELPRFGRSETARLVLSIPAGTGEVSARVVVLFRNRILQTAVLTGAIGKSVELKGQAALVQDLGALDDRRGFDLALLANHDPRGDGAFLRHSWPKTWVRRSGNLPPIAERIQKKLIKAADLTVSAKLENKKAQELLVELAVQGRDLYNELDSGGELGPIADANTIQVVTAGNDWFLPIELAYEREAPNAGAKVCERYLADPATCTGAKCGSAADLDVICPNAFWGLSKTIERLRFDPALEDELLGRLTLVGLPRANRRTLPLEHSVFAASSKVTEPRLGSAQKALEAGAKVVASWDDWVETLKGQDTQLLVLLPHTSYAEPSLEISRKTLERGRIEQRHVNGGRAVEPVVVLFGCQTLGNRGDPGGFAARFMAKKAAVVFHSLTDLRAGHAAMMAERLSALLRAPGREPRSLSELITEFRRAAVRDGLLAALAVSAYGDAEWRL